MNKQIMAAHEMAAIRMIGAIIRAKPCVQFGNIAQNLSELGPPANGAAGPTAADIIPKNLADGKPADLSSL